MVLHVTAMTASFSMRTSWSALWWRRGHCSERAITTVDFPMVRNESTCAAVSAQECAEARTVQGVGPGLGARVAGRYLTFTAAQARLTAAYSGDEAP